MPPSVIIISDRTVSYGGGCSVEQINSLVSSILPDIIRGFWRIVVAVVILIVGHLVIKKVCARVKTRDYKGRIEPGAAGFIASVLKIALYAVLIYTVAALVGIPTASIVALIGSAGLAIGLALQGSLSNFAGGILIMVNKPFKVGDYIMVDGGPEGTVKSIDIFYTRLTTLEERLVVMPNGTLSNSVVRNVSPNGERRIDLEIGISYSADIALAKKTVLGVLARHEKLIRPEDTKVFVISTGESSVNLAVRCWAKYEDFFTEKVSILEEIKLAFDEAGVTIPFNQLDVHIIESKNEQK